MKRAAKSEIFNKIPRTIENSKEKILKFCEIAAVNFTPIYTIIRYSSSSRYLRNHDTLVGIGTEARIILSLIILICVIMAVSNIKLRQSCLS